MEYFLHLLILISIYTILAQSLNLVAGYTGLISLAHAGFYGIGAYTTAILSIEYGVTFLLTFPLAMLISGLIALIVSIISIRSVDDYFIIMTLGIQVVIFSVMKNWQSLTRGPLGIAGIPSINIFGLLINNKIYFLIICFIFVSFVWFILNIITKSSYGRVLIALSEDEIFTKSLGKDVNKIKIISFTISAMLASIAGVLYAHYISYIDPTSFTINESIFILSIVIIGGMRRLSKIFLAVVFLLIIPELLRFIGLPNFVAANIRQMLYGGLLVAFLLWRPQGFIGKYSFNRNNEK